MHQATLPKCLPRTWDRPDSVCQTPVNRSMLKGIQLLDALASSLMFVFKPQNLALSYANPFLRLFTLVLQQVFY